MSGTPAQHVSPRDLLFKYCLYLVCGVLFFIVLNFATTAFLEINFHGSSIGIMLIFSAAMIVGQYWFRSEGAAPAARRLWTISFAFMAATLAIQLLFVGVLAAFFPQDAGEFLEKLLLQEAAMMLLIVIGFPAFIMLLVWLGLSWGVRVGKKKAENPST